jgi:peptidoglycan/LPS O-acetylase OafA/YrhL
MPRTHAIRYQPALDGLRALAVAAVLLFHDRLGWMSGGYLGVSIFFTLSGFLITSLLLVESEQAGRIDVRGFYARRARRLLPASLVCIAGVCVLAAAGQFDGVSGLRRDVIGALLQVFNWVKLGSGGSYADLNNLAAGLRHPLDHYWSLAIEEQFYWIWPVTVLGLLWLGRRRAWATMLRVTAALFVVFAVAAPVIAALAGPDAAYWATPARASEILAGAVVACWVAKRPLPSSNAWLAPGCLVLLGIACVMVPDGSGPAYHGGLPLVALISAGLIAGLQSPGPVLRMLSLRPLVALGRISYGVYLYHWPIYVVIDRQRWDLPGPVLLGVKLSITLAVAVVSYLVVERPVRRARTVPPLRTLLLAVGGTAVVAALVLVVPDATKFYGVDPASAANAAIDSAPVGSLAPLVPVATSSASTSSPDTTSAPTVQGRTVQGSTVEGSMVEGSTAAATTSPSPSTVLVPLRPVRILVVGDSTAEATGGGLIAWANDNPTLAQVSLSVEEGCGFVGTGFIPYGASGDRNVERACGQWLNHQLPATVKQLKPDVVVMLSTSWDVLDRRLQRTSPVLPVTDPAVRPVVQRAISSVTNAMVAAGAGRVVWLREPIADPYWFHQPGGQRDPANHQVLYDEMAALAATNPAIRVVDLAGWVDTAGLATDTGARPDGVHWSPDAAAEIASDFLGPAIIREALT